MEEAFFEPSPPPIGRVFRSHPSSAVDKMQSFALGHVAASFGHRAFHKQYQERDRKRQRGDHPKHVEIGKRRCLLLAHIFELLPRQLAACFAPANVAAYLYTPLALRGAAVGLLSLLRNEGGSVGMSLAQTFQERRDQFHTLRLGEYLDPFKAAAKSFLARAQSLFLQQTADPVALQIGRLLQ
jgi:hypothetical protein